MCALVMVCVCVFPPGRGESEGPRDIMARPPPAEKGILQRLKEVFWKEEPPEDEKEGGDSENRQKMS